MNKDMRKLWAEKTFEPTNIGAGALIFGQFISGKDLDMWPVIAGFALIAFGYILAIFY